MPTDKTARIDLDKLAADLEAAGIEHKRFGVFLAVAKYNRVMRVYDNGFCALVDDVISPQDWPILAIIATHTTEAP